MMLITYCVWFFATTLQAEAALLCGEVPVGCVIVKLDASEATGAAAARSGASLSNAVMNSSSSSLQSTSADESLQQQQCVAAVTLQCPAVNATEVVEPDASVAAAGSHAAGAYASAVVATGHNETNLTRNVSAIRATIQQAISIHIILRTTNYLNSQSLS
jgi:hypothetical protein